MERNVEKDMEQARDLSNGTMPLCVLFDTDEQVEAARTWMKGKQKVKKLIPITVENSRKEQEKRRKAIHKKLTT